MRRAAVVVVAAVVMLLGATFAGIAPLARGQESIQVVSQQATNEFPTGVTFSISFTSPAPAEEVRLRYELAPDGTGASTIADCSGGATTTCNALLASGRGLFVIPGAEITYHWDIRDEDGNTLSTDDQLYVHEDTRFEFEELTSGNVTLYYHSGDADEAQAVLEAARGSMDDLSALMRTQIGFPVKIFLYQSASEMQPAIVPTGGRGVQILGEVVYSDTAMVSADNQALDITRHEIAHIVTREATRGPFEIPGWLNEGISVYAQRNPLPAHEASLEAAIDRDTVLTMPELNSSSTGSVAETVGLYYGQSGSIVAFLINTYSEEKFGDLIATFRAGSTVDKAFETVYGFDAFGMLNAWRNSVGLPALTAPDPPTQEPDGNVVPEPTSSSGSGDPVGDDHDGAPDVLSVVAFALLGAGAVAAAVTFVHVVRQRL